MSPAIAACGILPMAGKFWKGWNLVVRRKLCLCVGLRFGYRRDVRRTETCDDVCDERWLEGHNLVLECCLSCFVQPGLQCNLNFVEAELVARDRCPSHASPQWEYSCRRSGRIRLVVYFR